MSSEELIQENAQRIDIARGVDRSSARLFRARVLRGHHADDGDGVALFTGNRILFEDLRDSEIEQLRFPFLGHKNIARLQIAVDHQVAMRVLDAGADLEKNLQTLARVNFSRSAPASSTRIAT